MGELLIPIQVPSKAPLKWISAPLNGQLQQRISPLNPGLFTEREEKIQTQQAIFSLADDVECWSQNGVIWIKATNIMLDS